MTTNQPTDCEAPLEFERLVERCNNSIDVAMRLIEIFDEELTGCMSELDFAFENELVDQVASSAHTIKGAAGMATAESISKAAANVEAAGKIRDLDLLQQLYPELQDQIQHFRNWVKSQD